MSQKQDYSKMFIGVSSLLYKGFHQCTLRNHITSEETWRFIKVNFKSINYQNIYRIQNCDSNEYLTIDIYDNNIFVSKEFAKSYNKTNHWLIMPFEDGESHVIKTFFNIKPNFLGGFLAPHQYNSNLLYSLYESQLFYPKK